MHFSENKPIYLQITEYFYDQILTKKWVDGDNIPSVRKIAVLMEVNPNTALRAFHELENHGIVSSKRGIGYFITEDAYDIVLKIKKKEFFDSILPPLFKDMKLLNISFEELQALYHSEND